MITHKEEGNDSRYTNSRKKIITYFVLCISNILSNAFYVLPYGVLTLYAYRNVDRQVYGFDIPVTWYLGFHTLCVIIFSLLLARLYNILGDKYNTRITLSIKLALGYIILALALFTINPFIIQVQKNSFYVSNQIYLIVFYALFALNKTFSGITQNLLKN